MPQLDYSSFLSQLFWLAISFAAIFFLVKIFILRIGEIVSLRQGKLKDDIDLIKSLKSNSSQLEEQYTKILISMKTQASAEIDKAISEGKALLKKKERELDNALKDKIESSKINIDKEKSDSCKQLNFLLPVLITEIMDKVVDFEYNIDNVKAFLNKTNKDIEKE